MMSVKNDKPITNYNVNTHNARRGLRFLTGDSAIYGGAAAVSKAAALITFPLLVRSYSVAEYGVIDFFLVFNTLAALTMVWGLDSAVGRYFWKYDDFEIRRILISQVLILQVTLVLLWLSILYLTRNWIAPLLLEYPDAGQIMGVAILQVPFLVLTNFCTNLLKWNFQRTAFLWLTLGATVTQTMLIILVVVVYEVSIVGLVAVYAISSAIVTALGVFMIRKWLCWPRRTVEMKNVVRYAFPLGIVAIIGAFSPTLERSLVSAKLTLDDLGYLAAAAKTGMLLSLLTAAFQTAWGPYYISMLKADGHEKDFDKVLRVFTFLLCLAVLLFMVLIIPLLQILATNRYLPAYELAVLISLALCIQGIGWITEIGIHISFKSYFLPIGHILGIATTGMVLWVFLPRWGLIAAGVGFVCANLIVAVSLSVIAQRVHSMSWSFRPVILCVALIFTIVLIALGVGRLFGVVGFISLAAGGLVIFIPIGSLILFSKAEVFQAANFIRNAICVKEN